jgi:iron only hydrogenase large subunit-like protein
MRELIINDQSTCVGCTRCVRVCPIEGANIAYSEGGTIKVQIDPSRCIVCGSCLTTCRHKVRDYNDDTERLLSDLQRGVSISMFAAPANRANGERWGGRLLTWLRQKGVKKIYDVSLGADICTWAHIRYIQKEKPHSVITQPCPAIVNYITLHKHSLLPYLSPVHSPMLCTAIYMKKYDKVNDKIAALSPCVAKSHEFEATGFVEYNVTLKKLYEYIQNNRIALPMQESGFDHGESSLGCLYSMPGGLKENVELHLGKALRIDKSEGQAVVYDDLDAFAKRGGKQLPAIFDVLNCPEGCNLGTGCAHERDKFEVNQIMEEARQKILRNHNKADFDNLYGQFDKTLRLGDFIRTYSPKNVQAFAPTNSQIEQVFLKLGKVTENERKFDCAACGSDTCLEMVKKIACGVSLPEACVQNEKHKIQEEHKDIMELSAINLDSTKEILADISKVRELSDEISQSLESVNAAMKEQNKMADEVNEIAARINMIALNASIEAARAGHHGKAFAVVASEIQRLADASKATVSETQTVTKQANASLKTAASLASGIKTELGKTFSNASSMAQKTEESIAKATS